MLPANAPCAPSHIRQLLLILMLLTIWIPAAHAQAVPEALSDWRSWALHDSDIECPLVVREARRSCSFPGAIALSFDAQRARFTQGAQVFKTGLLRLPGSADSLWPLSVTVDGRAAPVLQVNGQPQLELPPGRYLITGEFAYERLPERINLPSLSPITLRVLGQVIASPERENDELYLGQAQNAAPKANALDVEVHRLLSDAQPMVLETRITLRVSGEGRSALLGPVLPAGFIASAMDSELRAELKSDGMLSVQLKPGEWTITLHARADAVLENIALPARNGDWPEQETISFAATPELRTVVLLGPPNIDPSQANVPEHWHFFPSYLWGTDEPLTLKVESRGRDPSESNRLRISRELWLDFSGAGYSARDQISGLMVKNWRIDLRQPYRMTRAEVSTSDGEQEPLLVSKPNPELSGVEVRSHNVQLASSARVDAARAMPVSGLPEPVESVQLRLNTPPGWMLLAVNGASRADSTWVARWDVFAVFSIALLSFASAWLFGKKLALAMAAFLILSWFDTYVLPYLLFALLLLAALSRWLQRGWKQRVLRAGAIVIWLCASVSALLLMQQQIQHALYPQLGFRDAKGYSENDGALAFAPADAPATAAEPVPMNSAMSEDAETLDQVQVTGSRMKSNVASNVMVQKRKQLSRYASNSVIQAGVAEPDWRFISHDMSFDGPILPEQSTRFWLIGPKLSGALRLLSALLLAYIIYRLAFAGPHRGKAQRQSRPLWWQSWALMLLMALCGQLSAQALPSNELLQELRNRLQTGALCTAQQACISLSEARIDIAERTLTLEAQAQAGARTLVVLPYPERALSGAQFSLNGESIEPVQRNESAVFFILERGVHVLRYQATLRDSAVALSFAIPPQRVQARAPGFDISGVREGKLSADSVDFTRIAATSEGISARSSGEFPPYVQVLRQLRFDLNWQVVTTVRRLSEYDGGLSIKLPLIAGERPIDSRVEIKDGHALVPIARGDSEFEFTSNLARSDTLVLSAPPLSERTEVWTIEASPTWSVAFDKGVPQSLYPFNDPNNQESSDVQLRFDPLPGETLTLKITRPEAAPGPAYRIDQVNLVTRVGERARDSTLSLQIKATQGGRHSIVLPANAELMQVNRNGSLFNLRLKQGLLELPLVPGENGFEILFRESAALGAAVRTPAIDLKMAAANIDLSMQWPGQRWLLWTQGPRLGAAVMIWPAILLTLVLAFFLSRSGLLALRFASLSLLLLALLNLDTFAALTVLLCFIALHWRMQHGAALSNRAHWPSQVLLLGLSVTAFFIIVIAGINGLLSPIDMQVSGYGSSERELRWFADQSEGLLPVASAYGIPMWCYRALSLGWALWLAYALIGWVRYAKAALSEGGYWRPGMWATIAAYLRRRPASAENTPANAAESELPKTDRASSSGI
jgi:hypothetical protein